MQSQKPCQDRCASHVALSGDGAEVFFSAVSDGAGTAAHAERGAQLVCDSLIELAARAVAESSDLDRIADERVRSWFLEARERLRALARETETEIRDYAATGLLAVVSEQQTLCARVGDGGIVLRRTPEGPFEVALWPEAGEYANQTYFVTDDAVAERIAIRRYDDVRDVIAFSDGLQHLALEHATRSAFVPFFAPLVRTIREGNQSADELQASLVAYLNSAAVNGRTDDDKSLVIGCRLVSGSTLLHDGSGATVTLGTALGSGGEGNVYRVNEHPHLVAKIYAKSLPPEQSRKLAAMVRAGDDALRAVAAWPTGMLYAHAKPVGFTMPLLDTERPLHELFGPRSRHERFPHANWTFLIHTGRNLARAFSTLHERQIVVGDVNSNNIVVRSDSTARLIDCDSFQFPWNGSLFRCNVGVADYQPPELQHGDLSRIERLPQHDLFGLAVTSSSCSSSASIPSRAFCRRGFPAREPLGPTSRRSASFMQRKRVAAVCGRRPAARR